MKISLVLTQPDRPVGRRQEVEPTPVKQVALAAGLDVTQPEKIRNNAEFRASLEAIGPDAIVVVAYGRIISPWMLALPRLGCINLHGSLLPKYRGAAPIQWAVAMGETVTGNTTMLLEEGLDTGPILLQEEIVLDRSRRRRIFLKCWPSEVRRWWWRHWRDWRTAVCGPRRRITARATLAPLLQRDDGRMDFAAHTATELKNRWRGFQPWPGAFTLLDGKKLIVHRMGVAEHARNRFARSRARCMSTRNICWSVARTIRGWNFLKCSWKARSGCRLWSSCAECNSLPALSWVDAHGFRVPGAQGCIQDSAGG